MNWIDALAVRYLADSKEQAKAHAHSLTCWVSLNKGTLVDSVLIDNSAELKEFIRPLAGISLGNSLLSIPWAAYDKAYFNIIPASQDITQLRWLLSLPGAPFMSEEKQIDVGVYIDRFADMLREATNTVIISNPYWSENAVIRLFNRLHDWKPPQAFRLSLITRTELGESDQLAINQFFKFLTIKGIKYNHLTAIHESLGIVHAKFLITDNDKILLGSANLTHSGTSENIELSVYIESKELVDPLSKFLKRYFS